MPAGIVYEDNSGHYGEFLECFGADVTTVAEDICGGEKRAIFCISIEYAGDEPD